MNVPEEDPAAGVEQEVHRHVEYVADALELGPHVILGADLEPQGDVGHAEDRDEDFNRVWNAATLDGQRDSTELRRARALRPFVEAAHYLLDIHSMLEPSPPVMICGPLDKGVCFAFDIPIPRDIVSDEGHANGTRMRDFGGFGDPASPKNALLVECGQHWERSAEAVAWQTTWQFVRHVGVVDAESAVREIAPGSPVPQRLVRVTQAVVARTPEFRFARAGRPGAAP